MLWIAILALLYPAGSRRRESSIARADRALTGITSAAFVFATCAATLHSEIFWVNGVSVPAQAWFRSGFLAQLGILATLGCFATGSNARMAAATLALVLLGALVTLAPRNSYDQAWPAVSQAAVVTPIALALGWSMYAWVRTRRFPVRTTRSHGLWCLAALLSSAMLFGRVNIWPQGEATQHFVHALDLDTGQHLWMRSVSTSPVASVQPHRTSHATPTPCTDGTLVFAHFGSSTACVDYEGRVLWVRQLDGFEHETVFGAGSSPVLAGDAVIIVQEREQATPQRPSFVIAYEKHTGQTLWQVHPRDARCSYGTPLLTTDEGVPSIVTASWRSVVCYETATGHQRWKLPLPIEEVVTSLVRCEGDLVIAGGCVRGLTARVRTPRNGSTPSLVWSCRRSPPSCASPVVANGRIFTVNQAGIACCRDSDGRVLWRERLDGSEHFASPVAANGAIYFTDDAGTTTIVAAEDAFRRLGRGELDETVLASPAIAEGRILIRTERALYCMANEEHSNGR